MTQGQSWIIVLIESTNYLDNKKTSNTIIEHFKTCEDNDYLIVTLAMTPIYGHFEFNEFYGFFNGIFTVYVYDCGPHK